MIFAIGGTLLNAIRYNYPFKEVRTSYVSLSGLRPTKYIIMIAQIIQNYHNRHPVLTATNKSSATPYNLMQDNTMQNEGKRT